jgi:hypothetical protein
MDAEVLDDGPPDVVKLDKLDAALIELAKPPLTAEKIEAVALAWVRKSAEAQLSWLRYHPERTTMGASLRAALPWAAHKHDLGALADEYEVARELNRANGGTWNA